MNAYEYGRAYCADSAVALQQLGDASIDLVVTSPPYDSIRQYNGFVFAFDGIAAQLWRVLKVGGVLVWVVDDAKIDGSETGTSLRQALHFMSLGFNLHDKMIYEAINGAMGARDEYLQCFEMMFVFSKGKPKTVNLLRDRKNVRSGVETANRSGRGVDGALPDRVGVELAEYGRRKNIWRYAVGGKQEYGDHPAVMPLDLAKDHILSWSNAGDVVLDPFCGSGTTLKAAQMLGRQFIGFDVSAAYVQIANTRIDHTTPALPFEVSA